MPTKLIPCLFTHHCGDPRAHEIGGKLKKALAVGGIDLVSDPFRPGDQILARTQTLDLEALLFLLSVGSWDSPYCQEELRLAGRRRLPTFFLRLTGGIPRECRRRLVLDLADVMVDPGRKVLAESIVKRVMFRRLLQKVVDPLLPDDAVAYAQELWEDTDATLIAEAVQELEEICSSSPSPSLRYWIIEALGKAGTPSAYQALLRLSHREEHPLPADAIRELIVGKGAP